MHHGSRRLCFAAAVALLANLSGCVGYNTYNATEPEASKAGFTNVNSDPFPPIMAEAVRWAITRYPAVESPEWQGSMGVPPEGARFAVNLPAGVNRDVYQRVIERIGYGAVPLTEETRGLPTYHVGRIWVLGDEAKVDVVRPVPGLEGAGGQQTTQGITVRLRGGLQPWRVTSHRVWALNTMATPPLYFIPDPMGTGGTVTPAPQEPVAEPETDPAREPGFEMPSQEWQPEPAPSQPE